METNEVQPSLAKKRTQYSAGSWLIGWLVFLGSGFVTSVLLLSSWANCSFGSTGPGQLFLLVVAATGMGAVSTVLWAVMRKTTGQRGLLLPLVLTVLATAVLLWPALAAWYVSPGRPESMCEPGGAPLGWPNWLPL
ncbi:MAG: hypothetical protein LBV60_02545 [Streptomyces sp.]|jgi:hypothetical protein|nr:hypothetical protein [Streptomyces sp.]